MSLGVTADRAGRYLPEFESLLPRHGIDTPLRMAHFVAQVLHESGLMSMQIENLNHSAPRLLEVFPKYFDAAQAQACAGKPEAIGNRVYAGRMGNGDEDASTEELESWGNAAVVDYLAAQEAFGEGLALYPAGRRPKPQK